MKRFKTVFALWLSTSLLAAPMAWAADSDGDGVDDSVDVCASTVVPEAIPLTGSLGPHRYALSTLPTFDNNDQNIPTPDFTITDTGGCSCEQILANIGPGPTVSQLRRGCSVETMTVWTLGGDIDIEKSTNGVDADDPNAGDAPQLAPGDSVTWTYVVTNTGGLTVTNVVVTDDQGVPVACPQTTLLPNESMICTASGLAEDLNSTGFTTVPGLCGGNPNVPLYENFGTVTGDAGPTFVQDTDPSHYCNMNSSPVIVSDGGGATVSKSVAEDTTLVTDIQTIDDADSEASGLTYTFTTVAGGGVDNAAFFITSMTGVLSFTGGPPDYENPTDAAGGTTAAGDNLYEVQVTVTDSGGLTDMQNFTVEVTDVNEAPEITSYAGLPTGTDSIPENATNIENIESTDPDGTPEGAGGLLYSVTGGVDAAKFSIQTTTGILVFSNAPDFENPTDSAGGTTGAGDNFYEVQVTVTDPGGLTDVVDITVQVTDVNSNLSITKDDDSDPILAGDTLTYTVTVNNAGPDIATDVVVTDTLPAGVTFVSTTGCNNDPIGVPACNLGNIASGGLAMFTIQVTVDAGATGTIINSASVTSVPSEDPSPGNNSTTESTTVIPPGTPPSATDDPYAVTGNVGINVPAGSGVFVNDALGTPAATISAFDVTSVNNGTVTMNSATGAFTFTPAAGFTGNDSFSYTLMNVGGSSTATVSLTVSDLIWFVDNLDAGSNEGTLANPFQDTNTLHGANGDPGNAPGPGDCLFYYVGSGSYPGLLSLVDGQTLVGSGSTLPLDSACGISLPTFSNPLPATGGTRPVLSNAVANILQPAQGNTIRGLDLGDTAAGQLAISSITNVGTLTIRDVNVSGTGRIIGLVDGGTLDVVFDSVASTSSIGVAAILLNNVGGSFSVANPGAGVDTSITGATAGISVQGSGGLSGSFGETIIGASTGVGVNLGNAGGNFTFDSLDINTTTGQGLVASNSGTLNIAGTTNDLVVTGASTAVSITDTSIGSSNVTFRSITSTGSSSNTGIVLANTGSGAFTVTGTGTTGGSGGTIANKTSDAVTLSNTGGRVSLKNMTIQDIGTTSGGIDTRSQHDAIHGQTVAGGLTLDNVTIRRVSDMCVNGASFIDGVSATTWNGLDILNSVIEDCNRFHIAGVAGDSQDESAVRIQGLSGTTTIDNNSFRRAGSLLDLSTAASGTLTMNVTGNAFETAFKEFTSGVTAAIGEDCINVLVEGSATANVTIGGAGVGDGNSFLNCATSSIKVTKGTVPAGNANIDVVVDNNTFRVDDHSSTLGTTGNFPQGGVALRAGPGGISTFDAIVSNNTFGVAIGPDDNIGSTTDEVMNADGVEGNVVLIFESGVSQARVNNNTFNGSINAPWLNRADNISGTQTSAAVLYQNNNYRGRDDFFSPDPGFGTFRVPGVPYRTRVRNGGSLDISFVNDSFAVHDQFFFGQTEVLEFESRVVGGTMCVSLDNTTSPDGYEFDELVGTINLYQGAVDNAATGPCGVGATAACQAELADDGNRGGPTGYVASGTPNAALNPPFVDVDNGSIDIVGTACTTPSGGIF